MARVGLLQLLGIRVSGSPETLKSYVQKAREALEPFILCEGSCRKGPDGPGAPRPVLSFKSHL